MIRAADVSFTYTGAEDPAVVELGFEVDEGEIFGFLGPSGAGKSTTQKILIGLLREYGGELAVFGKSLEAWGPGYYEQIGVSFEQPNHYLKLTALENLRYFASLFEGETESPADLLAAVGLADAADQRVGEFSRGMKNRLNFARSLLNRPRLLFLDEPTAGLDPVNAQRVRDLIGARREAGATVFLTTHDMWAADQLCDRVAFIVDGRISLIEAPRELRLRHGKRVVRVEFEADGTDAPGSRPPAAGGSTAHRDFDLDRLGDDPEFHALLRERRIETIHTLEASLEDVFIAVTGRKLQ